MNAVTEVMKQAKSKKQFVFMMKQLGYGVRWEDSRKYITYTCPNGKKCRCAKLHGEKFSKELMEHEFKIRREYLDGTEQIRPESGRGNHAHGGGGQPKLDGGNQPAHKILLGAGGTVKVAGRADDQTGFGKTGESTDQNPTRNAENLEQHQEETIQMLQSSTQELQLQAGKLNEEFSLQRKDLEEWKHRTQLKMLRAIVISQSVLLILSLVLQIWLR